MDFNDIAIILETDVRVNKEMESFEQRDKERDGIEDIKVIETMARQVKM